MNNEEDWLIIECKNRLEILKERLFSSVNRNSLDSLEIASWYLEEYKDVLISLRCRRKEIRLERLLKLPCFGGKLGLLWTIRKTGPETVSWQKWNGLLTSAVKNGEITDTQRSHLLVGRGGITDCDTSFFLAGIVRDLFINYVASANNGDTWYDPLIWRIVFDYCE